MPKSGEPFQLPLSDALMDMLASRRKCVLTESLFAGSPWVFPAESKSGHIAEPREELDVSFTIHGLRNTFVTVAESLDISPYAIRMLVNHSTPDKHDVTAGYITSELERLRKPMQLISDRMRALLQGNHAV
jgi:integrase